MGSRGADLVLRTAVPADLPAIAAIYSHAIANTTATFDTREKSAVDMEEWMFEHGQRHPVLVAEQAGQVVGWACLSPWSDRCAYADTAENSVYVAEFARGRGVGKALLAELIQRARQSHLHTIIARLADGNPASERLHESAGFKRIGTMSQVGRKFGKMIDVHMYQLMVQG